MEKRTKDACTGDVMRCRWRRRWAGGVGVGVGVGGDLVDLHTDASKVWGYGIKARARQSRA